MKSAGDDPGDPSNVLRMRMSILDTGVQTGFIASFGLTHPVPVAGDTVGAAAMFGGMLSQYPIRACPLCIEAKNE